MKNENGKVTVIAIIGFIIAITVIIIGALAAVKMNGGSSTNENNSTTGKSSAFSFGKKSGYSKDLKIGDYVAYDEGEIKDIEDGED